MSADPEELKATTGLEARFHVERLKPSTRGIDHTDCPYFVLDPKHDPIARVALQVYANTARSHGHIALADDLDELLAGLAHQRLRTMIREAVGTEKPVDLGQETPEETRARLLSAVQRERDALTGLGTDDTHGDIAGGLT